MNTAARHQPELVVLVDPDGVAIGQEEKIAAHRQGGKLHRAFSILVFNSGGELLLQQRAAGKYHFPEFWSNTCCGHPRPGEDLIAAGERRLAEEFGFSCRLRYRLGFTYCAHDVRSGLTERELVDVLVGNFDGVPCPDPAEIGGWKWWNLERVRAEARARAEDYTPWFRLLLEKV
jgi:isopentenyl-diphosphate delta-isomerase